MSDVKFCNKCKEFKPVIEFYRGTRGGCRKCVREYQNRWYLEHHQLKRIPVPEGQRRCNHCGQIKALDEFYRDKTNTSSYHHYCKYCVDAGRKLRRQRRKKPKPAIPEGYKKCSKCQCLLALDDFYYLKKSKQFKSVCKECEKAYRQTNKARRNEHEKQHRSQPEVKAKLKAYKKQWRTQPKAKANELAYRQEYQNRPEVKARNCEHNKRFRAKPENQADARRRTIEWRKAHPERCHEQSRIKYLRKRDADGFHTDMQWSKLLELCGNKCLICGETKNLTRDHIVPLAWGGTDSIENIQPLCHKHNSKKHASVAVDYRPSLARAWAGVESVAWVGDGL